MIAPIHKEHPVFQSEEYRRDLVSFSIMEAKRQEGAPLAGDGMDLAVAFSTPEYPTWLWTAEGLDGDKQRDLCEYCFRSVRERGLQDRESVLFVCKPALTATLTERFRREGYTASCISMISFHCPNPKPPQWMPEIRTPGLEALPEIAELRRRFALECFGAGREGDYVERAQQILKAGILRAVFLDGQIAAIANLARELENYVSIGGVYTLPEYRRRGLAQALVYSISMEIRSQGRIPCLYTDQSNPSSNRAYQAVGFQELGRIDELTFRPPSP